jgi:hypothetical protein
MTTVKATQSTTKAGIFMPTHDQIVKTYGGIAQSALKNKTAKLMKHAPANFSKYPSYDISGGKMGVGQTVYAIKGELYLKTQVVAPGAKAKWFNVGPAPLF